MSFWDIFKRAKKVHEAQKQADEPLQREAGPFDLGPGDAIEVVYENYQIIGRAEYNSGEIVLTLEKGNDIKLLYMFDGTNINYQLYNLLDARLDSRTQVNDTMVMDDVRYYLEQEQDIDIVEAYNKTRFGRGQAKVWFYKSDDNKLLRIEWEASTKEFALYEGTYLDQSEVKIIAHREV